MKICSICNSSGLLHFEGESFTCFNCRGRGRLGLIAYIKEVVKNISFVEKPK